MIKGELLDKVTRSKSTSFCKDESTDSFIISSGAPATSKAIGPKAKIRLTQIKNLEKTNLTKN